MHLVELAAALGAAQGVLLLILVILRFRRGTSIPFALLLITFSLRLAAIPSWRPSVLLRYPWLFPLAGAIPLLFGPLVWWSIRTILRPEAPRPPRLAAHSIPWLVETALLAALIAIVGQCGFPAIVFDLFQPPVPWWQLLRHLVKVVHSGVYAVLAARLAFGSVGRAANRAQRIWARALVIAPLASLLAFLVVAVQPATPAGNAAVIDPFLVPAAVMMVTVYTFAALLLLFPSVLEQRSERAGSEGGGGANEAGANGAGGCSDDEAAEAAEKVRALLEAGAYTDPALTVTTLSRSLGVHPNRLSHCINRVFGGNFSQVVHDYRLRHFIARVEEGALDQTNILQLATDAGFASKSTFNRVFKERFGVSPSEYVAANRR
ncbi:MAG: AraC family transcriptional regulator [Spirochaetaceae bacterium]|nr:MAG: AraC family transcriptional regulator [Spirochaetaceae bacterium]